MRILLIVLICFGCISCHPDVGVSAGPDIAGYVPVYADPAIVDVVQVQGPQPIQQAGKMYAYGQYIYQNDVNKGIHIIDNSEPANPRKVAFISIPFSTEVAVKGRYLYTNNTSDLVVLDLQNPAAPVLVKRLKDAFPVADQHYPPFSNVYFECPDPSKGIVVSWELKTLKNPACRR